jgi:hypothetical protein
LGQAWFYATIAPVATDRYPAEARARLGELVERERRRQGVAKKRVMQSGSWEVYENVRLGRPVEDRTLREVEQALGLAEFACDDVLEGAEELRLADPDERRDPGASLTARAFVANQEVLEFLAVATPQQIIEMATQTAPLRARARQNRAK